MRWPPARYLWLLPIGIGLVLHSLVFDFVCDDAFISFVYSRNFAEHNELVFNLGDRVEGYTNFLWTFFLGLWMKVGLAPEISSRIFGTAFGFGSIVLVVRLMSRLRGRASAWDFLPGALLAASSGFACWSSGGMETQMFTFFATLGLWFYSGATDKLWQCGIAFALAAMTRPEGGLLFAACVLHRLLANILSERRVLPNKAELLWGVAFVAIYVPFFVWRWRYYGYFFPNTFYVKAGDTVGASYASKVLAHGLYYAWQWAWQSKAIVAIPFAVLGIFRHRRFGTLALLITTLYIGYVIKIGGDFMGLHRFVMPLFVIVALMAALGLAAAGQWLGERVPSRVPRGFAAVALVAVVFGLFGWSQASLSHASLVPKADNGIDRPGYLKVYAHDRGMLGKVLAPIMRDDDFSIVGGAGVQPYYARMRAIDVFGLVSEDIAHNVRPSNPRPGHQKWAPAHLLLKYKPSFVFHCYALHHAPRQYRLCGESGVFLRAGYEPVTIFVPGLKERGEYYTFLKRKDRDFPEELRVK